MEKKMTPSDSYIDNFGNLSVHIEIGRAGATATRVTGFNASPATVAKSLRDLADSLERQK